MREVCELAIKGHEFSLGDLLVEYVVQLQTLIKPTIDVLYYQAESLVVFYEL